MLKQAILRKVPEITIFFWIIKLLSTAIGESTSDYLVHQFVPEVAVVFGGIALIIILTIQFGARKYIAWIYWLAVIMVAVFGTMVADVLHVELHIPYLISSLFFLVILILIFIIWQRKEKTLSIHSITTSRREAFYWATVMTTFALGTATGDMTASTLGLGYFTSGIVFVILFVLPALAYFFFNVNEVACFWLAYILTRPLGASFADWVGKARSLGGLGVGDGLVSIVLLILILISVIYISIMQIDIKRK